MPYHTPDGILPAHFLEYPPENSGKETDVGKSAGSTGLNICIMSMV